jgi:uncharacterized membrane protein
MLLRVKRSGSMPGGDRIRDEAAFQHCAAWLDTDHDGEVVSPLLHQETKMKITNATLFAAAAAAASLMGIAAASAGPATAPSYEFEKCFGVAAGGQNDCQTATNSCAGSVAAGGQGDAWVFVPKGICQKIDGGSLEPK